MKRFVIVAALVIAAAFTANAQPKAGGMRFGTSYEISYQQTFGKKGHFLEENVGLFLYSVGILDGVTQLYEATTFNFMVAHPQWTNKGEWGMYVGPGIGFGIAMTQGFAGTLSALVQFGIEYKFDNVPVQLSLDVRPQFGFAFAAVRGFGGAIAFNLPGLWGFLPTMGVRYVFGNTSTNTKTRSKSDW